MRAAAMAVGIWWAVAATAQAACSPEQIKALGDAGFDELQITRMCAALEQPGPHVDPAAAFGSDVLTPVIGTDGAWKKFIEGDRYVLQNKGEPTAGYILLAQDGKGGWRSFGVEARFTHERVAEGIVGAALAFESGAPGGEIELFTLQNDGTVSLVRNSGEAVETVTSRQDPALAVTDWRFVTLGVRRTDDGAAFLVNGQPTGLEAPIRADATGSYGIAVFGIGSFEFRGFAHEGG